MNENEHVTIEVIGDGYADVETLLRNEIVVLRAELAAAYVKIAELEVRRAD